MPKKVNYGSSHRCRRLLLLGGKTDPVATNVFCTNLTIFSAIINKFNFITILSMGQTLKSPAFVIKLNKLFFVNFYLKCV